MTKNLTVMRNRVNAFIVLYMLLALGIVYTALSACELSFNFFKWSGIIRLLFYLADGACIWFGYKAIVTNNQNGK